MYTWTPLAKRTWTHGLIILLAALFVPHLPAPPLTQGIGVILNKNNKNCIARCNAHAALGVSTGVARTPAKIRRRAGVGNSVVGLSGLKDGAVLGISHKKRAHGRESNTSTGCDAGVRSSLLT